MNRRRSAGVAAKLLQHRKGPGLKSIAGVGSAVVAGRIILSTKYYIKSGHDCKLIALMLHCSWHITFDTLQ
jgi:hypothetical protein